MKLSNLLIVYMFAAFGWWAVHLWREGERLFTAEAALIMVNNPGLQSKAELQVLPEYLRIERRLESRHRMIIAEGLFFSCCLALGLWKVRVSAQREIRMARQRRNFLLSITHELKSPLAAIRLVLETFHKRELTRNQTQLMAANGLKDTDRLQALVSDMLLAAKLEDNWHPHKEDLSLQQIAEECAAGLRLRFPDASIQLEIDPALPPLFADRSGITSVILNLLENAIKYSPEQAIVQFRANALPNHKIRIAVADQGQGIPPKERQAIFEKFYRLGNEETRQTTGTGLGLYIVRQMVLAHKGSIKVQDNHPKGTVFVLEL